MRFCGGCGTPLGPEPITTTALDPASAAQRRYMTALFCDLVGSTPLAERLDPEEWREVLSAYQHTCVRAVERVGGYMARYVGDGVVAYFGYPRAHEDDAQRAVHAALGIVLELTELNVTLGESHDLRLRVRIGLHTGMVVAGQMGAGESASPHEIVGEMPHIAARLEAIAEPDSVVISDATQALIEGYFETESLGEQSLKGMSRPIGAYRVLRPTGAVSRLEVAGGRPLTPVVGREAELALLEQTWARAIEGSGQVVQISGEAGIGKSRLVRALVDRLGEQIGREEVWQCSARHRTTPLHPVIRYLERRLRLDRRQPADRQRTVLELAAREAGLDPADAVPLLADLLSIDGAGGPERIELAPRDARTATLRVLETILIGDRSRHPVMFVVEDLHWADPTTVELLDRIIGSLRGTAALCLLTFRREWSPPWTERREVIAVELGPLSSAQVREMVAAVDEFEPDARTLAWVDSAADGVPLFVEEMLKTLTLADAQSTAVSTPAVPPTLEGLLTERLDRLPDLGDVIDVASVIGRDFDRELLEELAPLGAADLDPALALLTAQGVLRPVAGTRSRFEFTHTLLQEAAYSRLLRRRRTGPARARRRNSQHALRGHGRPRAGGGGRSLVGWRGAGQGGRLLAGRRRACARSSRVRGGGRALPPRPRGARREGPRAGRRARSGRLPDASRGIPAGRARVCGGRRR